MQSISSFRYIFFGARLFADWENWDILDGSYFCFISLSSIGFGDIVPGASVRTYVLFITKYNKYKLINHIQKRSSHHYLVLFTRSSSVFIGSF